MKTKDTVVPVAQATNTSTRQARTVKGELIGDEASVDGNQRYILRGADGKEIPIVLTRT